MIRIKTQSFNFFGNGERRVSVKTESGILILEEKLSLRVGVGAVAILGGLVLTTLGFKKAKN